MLRRWRNSAPLPTDRCCPWVAVKDRCYGHREGRADEASAVAGWCGGGSGQWVGWTPLWTVVGDQREPLTDPVLDPAEHLLDLVAESCQCQRGPGCPVTARPPAVRHDGDGLIQRRGEGRDLGRGQVDGAGDMALRPSGCPAGVHQDEPWSAAGQRGVHVGDIGVERQPGSEVRGGVLGRGRRHPEDCAGGGVCGHGSKVDLAVRGGNGSSAALGAAHRGFHCSYALRPWNR